MKSLAQMDDQELQMAMRLEDLKEKGIDNLSDDELAELDAIDQKLSGQAPSAPAVSIPQPQRQYGVDEAALQGFGQGVSFGHLPQLQSALSQALPDPTGGTNAALSAQGFKIMEPERTYVSERDQFAQEQEQIAKQRPYSYGVGQIAGGIPPILAPTFAAQSFGGKLLAGAASGGISSFLQNPGEELGRISGPQIEERMGNVPRGAAFGAGFTAGAPIVAKGLYMAAPKKLREKAEQFAIDAIGAMKSGRRALDIKGNEERLGRRLLDEGVVTEGDDFYSIAKKIDTKLEDAGSALDLIYQSGDDFFSKLDIKKLPSALRAIVNQNKIVPRQIAKIFMSKMALRPGDVGYTAYKRALDNILNEISDTAGEIPLSRAREIRASIDQEISYARKNNFADPIQKSLLDLRTEFSDMVERRLRVKDRIAGTNEGQAFRIENDRVSDYLSAQDIAKERLLGEKGNNLLSLKGSILGTGALTSGMATGNTLEGIAGLIAIGTIDRVARQYGNAMVASVVNRLSRRMLSGGKLNQKAAQLIQMLRDNPNEAMKYIQKTYGKNPAFIRELEIEEGEKK